LNTKEKTKQEEEEEDDGDDDEDEPPIIPEKFTSDSISEVEAIYEVDDHSFEKNL